MNRKVLGIAAAVVVLLTIWLIARQFGDRSSAANMDYSEYFGMKLAEEAAACLPETEKLLLIAPRQPEGTDAFMEAYARGFEKAYRSSGGRGEVVRVPLEVDFMAVQAGAPAFTPKDVERLMQEHAGVKLWVCLDGSPAFNAPLLENAREAGLKLVVLAVFGGQMNTLFKAGVLHSAIVPREGAERMESGAKGTGADARFEREFKILRADGASS